jgi:hypothetical protein
MPIYLVFKYLHILTMFSAVTASVGPELLLHRVAKTGDVRAIRHVFALDAPLGIAVPILFLVGALLGLITAFFEQRSYTEPWLIIAYIIFLIAFVAGGAFVGPWAQKVGKAAAASPDDKPSAELEELIQSRGAETATWITIIAIIVIVFDMVVKPFS